MGPSLVLPKGYVDARYFMLVVTIIGEVVQGGLFFGWNALSIMMSDLGMYSEQCPSDLAPNELCKSQESRLAVLWTVGIFALNCGPVIMGFVLDYLGPKATGAIGSLLNILGLILFAVGTSSHGPRSFVPGAIFLGLGGITFHLAQFHASALFPRHRGLVASALVAGFTGSGIVMYLLLLIFQGCGSTRGAYYGVLFGYAGICALWIPLALWTMPNDPFQVGQVFLFRTHDWTFEVRRRADLEQLYSRGTALQDFIANRTEDAENQDATRPEAAGPPQGRSGAPGAGALPPPERRSAPGAPPEVELSLRAGADGRVRADIHAVGDDRRADASDDPKGPPSLGGAATGSAPALIDLDADHAADPWAGRGGVGGSDGGADTELSRAFAPEKNGENGETFGKPGLHQGLVQTDRHTPDPTTAATATTPDPTTAPTAPPSDPTTAPTAPPSDPTTAATAPPSDPTTASSPPPPPAAGIALTSFSSDPPPPVAPALPPGVAWGPLVFEARRFVTLRKKTFLQQLRSPESCGMGVFYTTNMFMMQLYLGSMRLQLSNKGDSTNAYSNFGNVVVAFAFLSMPLIAWLLDKKGYGATLGTINAMGVVTSLLQALPSLEIQAVTIILWMIGRFFMYASYFAIFGALFGFRNFGRLVAVDNTTNGVVGLLQYPITYLAIHALDGSFWIINLCQAAVLLPLFFFCAAMRRWERDDLVPIRPMEGEELPCDMVGTHTKKELPDLRIAETLHLDKLPDALGLDRLHLERIPEALHLGKLRRTSGGNAKKTRGQGGGLTPTAANARNGSALEAAFAASAAPRGGPQGQDSFGASRAGSPEAAVVPTTAAPPPDAQAHAQAHAHGSDEDAPPTDAELGRSWGRFLGWGARSRGRHGEDRPLHEGESSAPV